MLSPSASDLRLLRSHVWCCAADRDAVDLTRDQVVHHLQLFFAAPVLTGVAFSLATFACTAPFVGPLLVAASGGEWTRPVAGMLVYSTAFALPFLLLAAAPRWLARLPKSGPWMTDVRVAVAVGAGPRCLGGGHVSREPASGIGPPSRPSRHT